MYSILVSPRAKAELSKLPSKIKRQVAARIEALAQNPTPRWSKKLGENFYRGRSGDYRILYQVCHPEIVVLVIAVGDRKDVYRTAPERLVAELPAAIARLRAAAGAPEEE